MTTQDNIYTQIKSIASQLADKPIFILGKGPTLDQIRDLPAILKSGLVINTNDSHRIFHGTVSIHSAAWTEITDASWDIALNHSNLTPIPDDLTEDENLITRFESEIFYNEESPLVNALKVALAISRQSSRVKPIYLLGFDFSEGQAYQLGAARSSALRSITIAAQESQFLQLRERAAGIHHIGLREYSDISPAALAAALTPERYADLAVSYDSYPAEALIVAELTNNHLGSTDTLISMVQYAAAAGANLIKVQKRDVDTFYTAEQLARPYTSPFGSTLGDYRRGVELSLSQLHVLDATCRRLGIDWFCSVLDYPSWEIIREFKPKLVKIPSTISNHRSFMEKLAAEYTGAIVVSTGYTEWEFVDYVLDTFRNNSRIYLLHCVSAYPTPENEANIRVVAEYAGLQNLKVIPGYSSHDLGSLGCQLAVAAGAMMLEKHVKLGDTEWLHFDKVALDLASGEFARFVRDIRYAEDMLGDGYKRISPSEHHKYGTTLK